MGLALDELENTAEEVFEENSVKVVIDERIKSLVSLGKILTIDFVTSHYGSGFIVDGGSSC